MFKGRPGWEFTELGSLSLDAFAPVAEGEGGGPLPELLLETPDGIRLDQVGGGAGGGGGGGGGPFVLPLSVARERHPELVEPHLGTIVRDVDAFTARHEQEWQGGGVGCVAVG